MRSMAWMLEAAGIESSSAAGYLRTKGLAAVWLRTLRVWGKDDTPDMARTMAALDADLRRAEPLGRGLHRPTKAAFRRSPNRFLAAAAKFMLRRSNFALTLESIPAICELT